MDYPQSSDPLSVPEIRCMVFQFLDYNSLFSCALVSRSWATDTRRYLWQVVGSNGLDWSQCTISFESLKNRSQFIRNLFVDEVNKALIPKLATLGSTLSCLKILSDDSFSGDSLGSFLDFVRLVSPSLEELFFGRLRVAGFEDLMEVLSNARRLERLHIRKTVFTGAKSHGCMFVGPKFEMLPSLKCLILTGVRYDLGEPGSSEYVALELTKFFECCPNLLDLSIRLKNSPEVAAFALILPSLVRLKSLNLHFNIVPDLDLALVLGSTTTELSQLVIEILDIGVHPLAMMLRFKQLKVLFLELGAPLAPGQALSALLTQCHALESLVVKGRVDGTELALGPPWFCENLETFNVRIIGESRRMTHAELMTGGVPQGLWEENPGTHWMLYWRLSLLVQLREVKLKPKEMDASQHAFGHGFEKLRALEDLTVLYLHKFNTPLFSLEVKSIVDAWPGLITICIEECTNPDVAKELFYVFDPYVKVLFKNSA